MSESGVAASAGSGNVPTFASPSDFTPCVLWALGRAVDSRARRMVWVDPGFDAWPLDHPVLLDALSAWVRLPQRRLVLVASDFSSVPRRHPRFTLWRRTWAHAIEAWSPSEGAELSLPTLLLDDRHLCLQVHDLARGRGGISLDETTVRHWSEEIDVLLQRCEAAFPAHQLGL